MFVLRSNTGRQHPVALRRAMLVLLIVLVAIVAGGTRAPEANAAQVNLAQTAGYTGWAYVSLPTCAASAWIWRDGRWMPGVRTQGELVYVQPWSGGWYWSWTHYSGWQAIPAAHLVRSDVPLATNDCGWPQLR